MIGKIRKIYTERKRQTLAVAAVLSGFAIVALVLLLLGGEEKGLLGEKKPQGSIKILRGVDLAREKWRIEGEKRLGMIETEQREIKKGAGSNLLRAWGVQEEIFRTVPLPASTDRERTLTRSGVPSRSAPAGRGRNAARAPEKAKPDTGFLSHRGHPGRGTGRRACAC